ncbi:MAG: FAD-binding protein, partial [Oscillatoriales cyanobacterium]
MSAPTQSQLFSANSRPTEQEFDVIVIGSGIGGLVTATQLAAKKAKVLVLE